MSEWPGDTTEIRSAFEELVCALHGHPLDAEGTGRCGCGWRAQHHGEADPAPEPARYEPQA